MKVSKWGGSLAVRLPRDLVERMGLEAGEEIDVVDVRDRTLVVSRREAVDAAVARLEAMARPFPADFTFDREDANGR